MKKYTIAILALVISILTPAANAAPGNGNGGQGSSKSKMSRQVKELAHKGGNELVDVLITFKQHPGRSDEAHTKGQGAKVKRGFSIFPVQLVSIKANRLEGLSHNPNIEIINLDAPVSSSSVSAQKTANFKEEKIDPSITSWGIGVAVLDSGVGNHVDLWPSPVQYDFVTNPDNPTTGLYDGY